MLYIIAALALAEWPDYTTFNLVIASARATMDLRACFNGLGGALLPD